MSPAQAAAVYAGHGAFPKRGSASDFLKMLGISPDQVKRVNKSADPDGGPDRLGE